MLYAAKSLPNCFHTTRMMSRLKESVHCLMVSIYSRCYLTEMGKTSFISMYMLVVVQYLYSSDQGNKYLKFTIDKQNPSRDFQYIFGLYSNWNDATYMPWILVTSPSKRACAINSPMSPASFKAFSPLFWCSDLSDLIHLNLLLEDAGVYAITLKDTSESKSAGTTTNYYGDR
jgi:hypothetical protein